MKTSPSGLRRESSTGASSRILHAAAFFGSFPRFSLGQIWLIVETSVYKNFSAAKNEVHHGVFIAF